MGLEPILLLRKKGKIYSIRASRASISIAGASALFDMKQEDGWTTLPIFFGLWEWELWFVSLVQYRAWGLQYKKVILELDSTTVADAFSNCEVATPHLHAVLMGLITPHCQQLKVLNKSRPHRREKGECVHGLICKSYLTCKISFNFYNSPPTILSMKRAREWCWNQPSLWLQLYTRNQELRFRYKNMFQWPHHESFIEIKKQHPMSEAQSKSDIKRYLIVWHSPIL